MSPEAIPEDLHHDVIDAKDHYGRQFQHLTNNFYIMRAALRYFKVKKGMSFTSSKIANNFPVTAPVAGSCLKILEELQIIEKRTNSSSASRYMPKTVDMDRMLALEKILIDSYEITDFQSSEQQ